MKQIILIISLLISTNVFCQNKLDRAKTEASVTKYMTSATKNYQGLSFGEFFYQTYPKEIQAKMKTKKNVVYSLVHTYSVGKDKYIDTYFHLNEKYEVIGKLTMKEMDEVFQETANKDGKLDSLLNSFMTDSIPKH